MKMNKLLQKLIISIVFITYYPIYGQNYIIKVSNYYSTFSLADLKNYQKEYTVQLGNGYNIPYKIVDNFPSFFSYQISVGLEHSENLESGLVFNYSSTAARSDYQDYSGNLRIDYLLSSSSYGVYSEYSISLLTFLNGVIGSKILYNRSVLALNNKLIIFNESENQINKYESTSFSVSPYLAFETFYKCLILRFNTEYMIDFNGELVNIKNKKNQLPIRNGSVAKTNWSGFRIGIDFGIRL